MKQVRFMLKKHGRAMILRRRIGTSNEWREQSVKGFSVAFGPEQLTGAVVQGDRRIRISPLDVGDWPGPPPPNVHPSQWPNAIVAGDQLDGANVQGAELRYDGENPSVWVVWVRG